MTPDEWLIYLHWRPQFAEILDPRFYTIDWLDGQVLSGKAQLVACEDAAALVELRTYPTGAVEGHGLLCCGELSSITETLIPLWLSGLRSIGAISAVVESRQGWAKALKPLGFDPFQQAVRKIL